jgi:hypothetical protein
VTASGEIRIQGSRVLINLVEIPARGVGLPNLNEGVGDRAMILIENAAANDNALALRRAAVLRGEVAGFRLRNFRAEERPRDLGKSVRYGYEWLCRSTLDGGNVWRMQMRRLCTRLGPAITSNFGHATSSMSRKLEFARSSLPRGA